MLNRNRAGKITSSEAFKIYESKTVQKTYMNELRMYNLFNHKDVEKDVFNFKWGHLLENYLHEKTTHLEGYINQNSEDSPTIFSIDNPHHCGTPDQYTLFNEKIVTSETKCPVTLKGLYNLIFPFYPNGVYTEMDGDKAIELIRDSSKDGNKYFLQIISNAVLLEENLGIDCEFGELIVFMPYKANIQNITAFAEEFFLTEYYPILFGTSETLPCIWPKEKEHTDFYDLDDEYPVKDFHRIRFSITHEMKDTLVKDLKAFTKTVYPNAEAH